MIFTFPGGGLRLDRPIDVELEAAGSAVMQEASDVLGWNVLAAMRQGRVSMHPARAQPTVTALWSARAADAVAAGWEPAAAGGHSAGEWTAAVVTGSVGLADALRLLVLRGALIEATCGVSTGTMLAVVGPPVGEVEQLVDDLPGVWLAATNGPNAVVLSALRASVPALHDALRRASMGAPTDLAIPFPSHCPLMKEVAEQLVAALADLVVLAPVIPFVGCSYGDVIEDGETVRERLARNVARRVVWERTTSILARVSGSAPFADLLPQGGMRTLLRQAGVRRAAIQQYR